MVTLLSSRSSGSSYLNKVELQNGYLGLGHANLFIPSTLNGSAYNSETGSLDMEKVKTNLELATDVYIECVNCCPCGQTVIHLYRGADSSDLQERRKDLNIFLKGSRKKKEQLRKQKPELYEYFRKVWDVGQRHEVPGLPSQYLYLLVCCFENDCPHPLCQRGSQGLCILSSTDPILPVAHFTNVSMHCRHRHHTLNPHDWERLRNLQSGNESAASGGRAWERFGRFSRPASYTQLVKAHSTKSRHLGNVISHLSHPASTSTRDGGST